MEQEKICTYQLHLEEMSLLYASLGTTVLICYYDCLGVALMVLLCPRLNTNEG